MPSEKKYLLGLDIGGTKLSAVLADRKGHILHTLKQPTCAQQGPQAVLDKIFDMLQHLMLKSSISAQDVACLGVSCPGPVDTKTGVIHNPPNLPGWSGVPLKKLLEDKFGILTRFENDANAAALAEMRFGAGTGYKNLVYLTMSTGIGGGIIIDGKLYRGAHGKAGEVGHQTLIPFGPLCGCGKRGCLEALCSGVALTKRMQEAVKRNPESLMLKLVEGRVEDLDPQILIRAAKEGDRLALEIWDRAGYFLGWGLANLVNILDPEIFILGTIAIYAGELLLKPAREALAREVFDKTQPPPPLVPAKLGAQIGDYGALAIALL